MANPAIDFAQEAIARARSESSNSFHAALGAHAVAVHGDFTGDVGKLIREAFLPTEVKPDFDLYIWRGELPDLSWARDYLQGEKVVPEPLTPGYRIAFDQGQGLVMVLDTSTNNGAIWVAADINLASFITPFRVMMSWFAHSFGGEIIHASVIEYNGKGILLNGASGSGKSTMALLALQSGAAILCDDVSLYVDGVIYAIYARGKVSTADTTINLEGVEKFELPDGGVGKAIVELSSLNFMRSITLNAIVLPVVVYVAGYARINSALALTLLAPNSLREILGGTPRDYLNLKKIVGSVPTYRLALSGDYQADLQNLIEIAKAL